MTRGIPAGELSDEELLREMRSLHRTRDDTLRHGPESALDTHEQRTEELEAEYLLRFPEREITRGPEREITRGPEREITRGPEREITPGPGTGRGTPA